MGIISPIKILLYYGLHPRLWLLLYCVNFKVYVLLNSAVLLLLLLTQTSTSTRPKIKFVNFQKMFCEDQTCLFFCLEKSTDVTP